MRAHVRRVVDRRWPLLAELYRTVRDDIRFARAAPTTTSDGFLLSGDASMQSGAFEPEVRQIVASLLPRVDVFVDVGANVGYYSCMARQAGRTVVAVEPLHANLRYLYRNLRSNGWRDVEVWPVALGSVPGIQSLYGAATGASLVEGWAGASGAATATVPVATLDAVLGCRFEGRRLLVKIDVEGGEADVLAGATSVLAMRPPGFWIVEITLAEHRAVPNARYLDTFARLLDLGYRVETADANRRHVTRVEIEAWMRAGLPADVGHNWLFTPA